MRLFSTTSVSGHLSRCSKLFRLAQYKNSNTMNAIYLLVQLCIVWRPVSSSHSMFPPEQDWSSVSDLDPRQPGYVDDIYPSSIDLCNGSVEAETVIRDARKCSRFDSCFQRCGEAAQGGDDCSCDSNCLVYGDCCYDYGDQCQSNSNVTKIIPATAAVPVCVRTSEYGFGLVLGKGCSAQWKGTEMEKKCFANSSVVTHVIPVTDVTNQLHYANMFCARCNDVTNYTFWSASFICQNDSDFVANVTDPLLAFEHNLCDLVLHVSEMRRCISSEVVVDCQPESSCSTQIRDACKTYKNIVQSHDKAYQNEYCAICNNENLISMHCPRGGDFLPDITYEIISPGNSEDLTGSNRPSFGSFSFSIVMDFSKDSEVQVGVRAEGTNDVTKCTLDGVTSSCIPSQCRRDYVLIKGTCVLGVVLYDVDIYTHWKTNVSFRYFPSNTELNYFGHTLSYFVAGLYGEKVRGAVSFEVVRKGRGSFQVHNRFKLQFDETVDLRKTEEEWRKETRNETFSNILAYYVDFVNSTISLSLYYDPYLLDKALTRDKTIDEVSIIAETDCERVRFDSYNTTENGSIVLLPSMTMINESDAYYETDGSILVCQDVLNFTVVGSDWEDETVADDSKGVLGILTIVCTVISLLCLLIRIALQPFVRLFQTFPGKLQLCLCCSLVMWKIFFLARPFASSSGNVSACIAVAVLFHWSLLTSFFWMNVIAVDLWKTFRSTAALKVSAEANKTILGYACYATFLPGGIVAVCLVLDYIDIDPQFKPNYQGPACYISNIYPLVLFLVAPIGVVLIVNIILYAMIAKSLHAALSTSLKLNMRKNKHSFVTYLRLFALMGTTWIFGFLSGGLGILALEYIFVILTTLDGLFIFIAVVCSRRVWEELLDWKCIIRSSTPKVTQSSSSAYTCSATPTSSTMAETLRSSTNCDTEISQV
ncbi:uncharacterized protein LOC106178969 [Lingula anatina]|uniref:Uncharacterized protein LOC106178969 n=1 Tax=Lingula anatina TaxID=7574 RepID=A0A1S3K6H3_LINAN|nr:uncharacterized protein LOC106178969 [Lingula anatina]XP_013417855.1 uncharacterized protein LOC106178969 [Lingula anatina]XP_013417856.1 uncharacterized protein LOC106178969 [Lingula anatina]XP_013417857.1 uncharacterized protein LOC106178969 [Lingula anatina]XP_013417858.1 uncharacterized protein LOC106178969 [Lingula anatina]|eukprot:XP_013417853.1 uncharacterized protein LOC106178969 [Lingula anatina]